MKQPIFRFKGYTDDWEQRKLSSIYNDIGNAFVGTATPYYVEDGHFYLESNNIKDGQINHNSEIFINEEFYEKQKDKWLHTGDMVMVQSGHVGHAAVIPEELNNSAAHALIMFRHPKDKIEPYFLNYEYQTNKSKKKIENITTGNTIKHILASDMQEFIVDVASYQEQVKIADWFRKLDNLISLNQRKCDALKKLKKGMLQKMFPKDGEKVPEFRFKGFTGDWEQCKLGDFGNATGGTSIESDFAEDGAYKVISIGSYSEDNTYRDQGIRAVESEKTANRVLNKDDITMILNDKTATGNIIGRVLLIEESGRYVYNQRTERIEVNKEIYAPLFIYEMLNAPHIRDKIVKQCQGNTQIYVNWSTIAMTEYMVPNIEEQRLLGAYFASLDNLITLHQRKCDALKELKKGMLQKMFI